MTHFIAVLTLAKLQVPCLCASEKITIQQTALNIKLHGGVVVLQPFEKGLVREMDFCERERGSFSSS